MNRITTKTSHRIDLSGLWKYHSDPGDDGLRRGWHHADFDDSDWEDMQLPGPWGDQSCCVGWYRRQVTITPELLQLPLLKLMIRRADHETEIFINGDLVKEPHSWNAPYYIDLKELLGVTTEPIIMHIAIRYNAEGGWEPNPVLGVKHPIEIRGGKTCQDAYETDWFTMTPQSVLQKMGQYVLYSVYVRNFTPEGTFEALRARLPVLKSLGVNLLWLLPIHEIGEVGRKGPDGSPYAIRDYRSIHPELGTAEDLRRLIKDVHRMGMKIIIDCVMNHTSPDSVHVTQHPDWFIQDEQGVPRSDVPEWQDVVDWDWDRNEVWEYNVEIMEYWIREFDLDGYRCDVADLVPNGFWSIVRERLEAIKPGDIIMLAESNDPGKHLCGFDLTYNEGFYDVLGEVISGKLDARALRDCCLSSYYGNPRDAARMLFVENHDKERAINEFGGPEAAKLAAMLSVLLPGVPLVYTGTEVGASPDRNRTFFQKVPVDFAKDPHGMRAYWKSLLTMRNAHPCLQFGALELIECTPEGNAFAFTREYEDDKILVIANLTPNPLQISMDNHAIAPVDNIFLGGWQWTIY